MTPLPVAQLNSEPPIAMSRAAVSTPTISTRVPLALPVPVVGCLLQFFLHWQSQWHTQVVSLSENQFGCAEFLASLRRVADRFPSVESGLCRCVTE